MTAAGRPLVSVVVVTWNGLDLTRRCLASLRDQEVAGADVRLVVVDNGSQDGTVRALRGTDVEVVALPSNRGFAAGVNAGVRALPADVVVLVNNDAVAEPGYLEALVRPLLDGDARVGATTGRVVLSGRFERVPGPSDARALRAAEGTLWRRTEHDGLRLLNSSGNEVTVSGNGRDRDWLAPEGTRSPAEVFGFNGGSAALRAAALADVGPLEERLFMYYEDTELSWRLRRRGWTVCHVPDAVTVHDHAASSGTASSFFLDHNERNRLLVALVHAPWPVVARAVGRATARAVLGPHRRRRVRALARVAALVPWALRRRRAVDARASVPRAVPAALLVPEGAA